MESGLEKQTRQFIALLDVLAERLRPQRRPRDVDQPECSQPELRALNILGQLGTLTMTDLASALGAPISTATRVVDRLAAKELVERTRASPDRRVVRVRFSRRGKRINQFVVRSRIAAAQAMISTLPPHDRERMIQGLARVAAASGASGIGKDNSRWAKDALRAPVFPGPGKRGGRRRGGQR